LGASDRLGPELEICNDHFLEADTFAHCWESLLLLFENPCCTMAFVTTAESWATLKPFCSFDQRLPWRMLETIERVDTLRPIKPATMAKMKRFCFHTISKGFWSNDGSLWHSILAMFRRNHHWL
jgi:hypothetical protein